MRQTDQRNSRAFDYTPPWVARPFSSFVTMEYVKTYRTRRRVMTDEPFTTPGHRRHRGPPTPGETLFECYRERIHAGSASCAITKRTASRRSSGSTRNSATIGGSRRGRSRCSGPRKSGKRSRKAARDGHADSSARRFRGRGPAARICGWCRMEIAPGTQPATYGVCRRWFLQLELDTTRYQERRT